MRSSLAILAYFWVMAAFAQTDRLTELDNRIGQLVAESQYPEAIERTKEAINLATQIFGRESEEVAYFVRNLSVLYRDNGDYVSAETWAKRALILYGKTLGAADPKTLEAYRFVGSIYAPQGRY
jgi:tetratricopeptide (TPR) repeat protein